MFLKIYLFLFLAVMVVCVGVFIHSLWQDKKTVVRTMLKYSPEGAMVMVGLLVLAALLDWISRLLS